ncbi:hypothetical protein Taro_018587 [Colocasia esculenta]|uniref:Acylamino-acid-releasing enzyme N-terminal domain-containing protein n=1 Tax=Colocasia esculenta TaxID=4460 RepID=A0A843V2X4_COLES|nr:hypothetical protein [Colocasia esculenta]
MAAVVLAGAPPVGCCWHGRQIFQLLPPLSHLLHCPPLPPPRSRPLRLSSQTLHFLKSFTSAEMQVPRAVSPKEMPLGIDAGTVEEYAFQSKLLKEFTDVPSIDKAWIFKSDDGNGSRAMFSIGQANLLANKKRTFMLSSHISRETSHSVNFQWSPFPVEMTGVSAVVPSPSGTKLLVVRNKENDSPTCLEIWGPSQLQKEIHIPRSVHGPVYIDGWFEGISWNHEETLIAYVAEEPSPSKPTFSDSGFKMEGTSDKDFASWKGQGEWEEDWGETYSGKRKPALFIFNIHSGKAQAVEGIDKSLSVGQVVWAPLCMNASHNYLVFVGWLPEKGTSRKLGIKYCYNRPCALYAVEAPIEELNSDGSENVDATGYSTEAVKLSEGLNSAFFPRFSPDGKSLVFLSAKCAVDSGAHWATNSLHRMDWPADGKPCSSTSIIDVVTSWTNL